MTQAFLNTYGNPDIDGDGVLDQDWFNKNIRLFTMPWPMRISWGDHSTISRFQAHRLSGARIISALIKMRGLAQLEALEENEKLESLEWMRKNDYDLWGGCFNFRLVRGGNTLSNHSWGTAVDICPDRGAMGDVNDSLFYPPWISQAFESESFYSGTHFAVTDGMHFELRE